MTTDPDRLVVRPRPWKLALYALGAFVFVVIGSYLLRSGGVLGFVFGALAIAFFAGGFVFVLLPARKRGLAHLTLTRDGLELSSGGRIPWADVGSVDVVDHPTKMVTLRLNSYDAYLASGPDDSARLGFLRPFAHVLRMVPSLKRFATEVRGPADELRWNRETYGFDIGISPMWLDRSPREFVELVESYRSGS
ncbi:hypothetical protein BBK82_39130 [Lentzea guizhouensis]|uniref:Uncharacterized protein n=1 Tax=Lentzea guizhouensis TaxID=1586287 RepID=A0A1B2HTP9_9PSEU|nr:STM3941 family protein [Lentzea guizhouensis]ANZ41110.1 hypothetical protein BBK82_39130 [Lentzea guizhouensis]